MKYLKVFEELSSELLRRAEEKARTKDQHPRGSRFGKAAGKIESDKRAEEAQQRYNHVIQLTGDNLFGGTFREKTVNTNDRVTPLGDTWLTIVNPTASFNYTNAKMVYLIGRGGELEIHYVPTNQDNTEGKLITINDIRFADRGQAMKWHKFINYWNNTEIPFNVDLYKIKNINA